MDINAIMLENKKKRTRTSPTTLNKVIKKVSLLQEGDIGEIIGETTTDVGKPDATSNVVGKIIEVAVEE
jgi:hypothetical protein